MSTTLTPTEDAQRLAAAFSGVLNRWLTADEMEQVRQRNAAEANPGVCHSHDFCDANEAMASAFMTTFPDRDLTWDVSDGGDEHYVVWNAAWEIARAAGFAVVALVAVPQWQAEFGPGYEVPQEIADMVAAGRLHDQSWHNDVCPSFTVAAAGDGEPQPTLWVDHPDADLRELQGDRFSVTTGDENDPLYTGDDLTEALTVLRAAVVPMWLALPVSALQALRVLVDERATDLADWPGELGAEERAELDALLLVRRALRGEG